MNKRKLFQWAVLGYMMLTGMTACSSDDDTTDIPDDGVKVRRITITQTDDAAARQMLTRSTLVESDGLTASWTAGDGLTYCNLSRTNPMNYEIYTGPLTAASTASTSQFTGNVTCNAGDYLAVVYPAATFVTNESYTISLSGQDGTLGTLATNYHYVYGKAYVTSVTDNTANATMEKMKSLLTVCKFSFVDKTTGAAIPIKTLAISYGGSGSDARTPHLSADGHGDAKQQRHLGAVSSPRCGNSIHFFPSCGLFRGFLPSFGGVGGGFCRPTANQRPTHLQLHRRQQ